MRYEGLMKGRKSIYEIPSFRAIDLNEETLRELCIGININEEGGRRLHAGSERFKKLYYNGNLTAPLEYEVVDEKLGRLEIHNYTGMCPTNVLEVNPALGSCSASCLYCLVSDGDQARPIKVIGNYPEILGQELEIRKNENMFFYFSPKTEAFSEPLLETGVSHGVLRTFIEHYQRHPDSKARLFIATKAGPGNIEFKDKGESIIELLARLEGKVQVNGSIGIMPKYLHEILEPNAATVEERLAALQMMQSRGIYARAVLSQPIIPYYLNAKSSEEYFKKLAEVEIKNAKPEFLTVNMENLAIIAQFINHFDRERLGEFLGAYAGEDNKNHIKQRCRTAPSREVCKKGIELIIRTAGKHDIGVSICNWVRKELGIDEDVTSLSRQRGFRCLGYQDGMFKDGIR